MRSFWVFGVVVLACLQSPSSYAKLSVTLVNQATPKLFLVQQNSEYQLLPKGDMSLPSLPTLPFTIRIKDANNQMSIPESEVVIQSDAEIQVSNGQCSDTNHSYQISTQQQNGGDGWSIEIKPCSQSYHLMGVHLGPLVALLAPTSRRIEISPLRMKLAKLGVMLPKTSLCHHSCCIAV